MSNKSEYKKALILLEGLYYKGMKLGLKRTRQMLDLVGNPQDGLRCVHVAGTNGKGSVCSFLSAMLQNAGLKTGLYTSPHLVSIRERFRINGDKIEKQEFADLVFSLYDRTRDLFSEDESANPTFFEFITVLAFTFFRQQNVDIAVVEVGMGGRLDSTNVITPAVSVITNIDLDHTKALGNTLSKIAHEKGGIIKRKVPIVCGKCHWRARQAIENIAQKENARTYLSGRDFRPGEIMIEYVDGEYIQRNRITYGKKSMVLSSRLLGRHQGENLATAYATLKVLNDTGIEFPFDRAVAGSRNASWPTRFQILPDGLVLDAAHNPGALKELAYNVNLVFPNKKWNILFAVLKDKEWRKMLKIILPLSKSVYLTEIDSPRAESALRIEEYIRKNQPAIPVKVFADVRSAWEKLKSDGDGLIFGSIYMAGEVFSYYYSETRIGDV